MQLLTSFWSGYKSTAPPPPPPPSAGRNPPPPPPPPAPTAMGGGGRGPPPLPEPSVIAAPDSRSMFLDEIRSGRTLKVSYVIFTFVAVLSVSGSAVSFYCLHSRSILNNIIK